MFVTCASSLPMGIFKIINIIIMFTVCYFSSKFCVKCYTLLSPHKLLLCLPIKTTEDVILLYKQPNRHTGAKQKTKQYDIIKAAAAY
jgi:hypothetical protein